MDRQYLRIAAVYRLMDRRGLSQDRAIELLAERNVKMRSPWLDTGWRGRCPTRAALTASGSPNSIYCKQLRTGADFDR